MSRPSLRAGLPALVISTIALPAFAQERAESGRQVDFTENRVEIYNAVGSVTLRRATGNAITVTATAQGADGSQLTFEVDRQSSGGRFRVVYPEVDAIASPPGMGYGSTELDLRADGTFGGDHNWRRRGDRVRIGSSRGFRGYADVVIGVPDNRVVRVFLAIGRATADGVTGDVVIDTHGSNIEATNIAGTWLMDTGSGDVSVNGMRGTLRLDTGSGNLTVSRMTGDLLDADTGSGDVDATDVQVDRFNFDTGSGNVRVRGLTARRGVVDTGSGNADIVYSGGAVDDLTVDTGSGRVLLTLPAEADARVSIETGGGDATINRTGVVFERRDEDGVVLRIGQGRGRIRIDTGSGDVVIR
jgi:hypothetical protein